MSPAKKFNFIMATGLVMCSCSFVSMAMSASSGNDFLVGLFMLCGPLTFPLSLFYGHWVTTEISDKETPKKKRGYVDSPASKVNHDVEDLEAVFMYEVLEGFDGE